MTLNDNERIRILASNISQFSYEVTKASTSMETLAKALAECGKLINELKLGVIPESLQDSGLITKTKK